MAIELKGAVACVTGAGRGIGAATARALAEKGARVVMGDIDEELVRETARQIGPNATATRLDVADPDSFAAFIDVARAMGPVDLLVNNAGIQRTGDFLEQALEAQLREIHINLGGVITGMRLVLPDMVARQRGHIVNLSSMAGKMTVPGAAVYTASKFGVASLSRAVRAEIADSGVTLTTLLPAAVQTELTAGLNIRGVPKTTPETVAKAILASCRHGHPEVTVPRWVAPIGSLESLLPERLGERIKRAVGARKRITEKNEATRKYQDRVLRS
ncbi:SDR family oxidoreductase [Isoalcanivorax indicus]|uniref:SDR family oxidoreductase n=1 Tax=Isoalcanivorax indicus TaxID=2202653 RepID=UPI000DB9844E|nr:SDR family oxidoreductase [Isoalcanivorax indicus]